MYKSYKAVLRDPPKDFDFMLIGKSGHGKSAAGNAILNKKAFKQCYHSSSQTKYPQYDTCEFLGHKIQVVDSPGIFDTDLNAEDGIELFRIAMQNAVFANPEGYHAFLIVVRFGSRFTYEEAEAIEVIKCILGREILDEYGIILMTNGDNFKKEVDSDLETYCEQQTGAFKNLLIECKNRIVLFDNMATDQSTINEQREKLLKLVKTLNNDDKRYTNIHFRNAKERLKNEMKIKDFVNTSSYVLDILRKTEFTVDSDNLQSMSHISEDVSRLRLMREDISSVKEQFVVPVSNLIVNLDVTQCFVDDFLQKQLNKKNIANTQVNTDEGDKLPLILQNFQNSKEIIDDVYFSNVEDCVNQFGHLIENSFQKEKEK